MRLALGTASLLALCSTVLPVPGRADDRSPVQVGVLLGSDSAPYQEVVAGFQARLHEDGVPVDLQVYRLADSSGPQAVAAMHRQGTDLVLAVGSQATMIAARGLSGVPVVSAMALRPQELDSSEEITGVYLEFPLDVEFAWLKRLLPDQKRIGVVYQPAENQAVVDRAASAARALGLELCARRVQDPREIPAALQSLATEADVLWGLADRTVLTPETAESILLFCLRNKIPFVGLSSPWVKAGAIYALDRDYRDIGAQCGDLALSIFAGRSPAALPAVPPRKVLYSINQRTADHLHVRVAPDILKGAKEVVR